VSPRAREDSVRPRRLAGVIVRPLNFTVRGQPMRRRLLLAFACVGLVCAYGYALWWVFEAALPMPRWWTWFWIILTDTLTLILVSVPVAALVARFGGRNATAVALLMTVALFVATVEPSPVQVPYEAWTRDGSGKT
jgi:hypothetical protein